MNRHILINGATLISYRDIFLLVYLARLAGRGKKREEKKLDAADCNFFATCLLIIIDASSLLITKYCRFAPKTEWHTICGTFKITTQMLIIILEIPMRRKREKEEIISRIVNNQLDSKR